jgi:hypothetical protein
MDYSFQLTAVLRYASRRAPRQCYVEFPKRCGKGMRNKVARIRFDIHQQWLRALQNNDPGRCNKGKGRRDDLSPGSMPGFVRLINRASAPLAIAMQCFATMKACSLSSSSLTSVPMIYWPCSNTRFMRLSLRLQGLVVGFEIDEGGIHSSIAVSWSPCK